MKLCPYLTFDGNAHDVIAFYAAALNGTLVEVMRFDEMPGSESDFPPEIGARLAHAQVHIGDQVIMVSDTMGNAPFKGHHGFSIQMDWKTIEEAEAAFNNISEGGTVELPFGKTFWASAFGVCRDKFGVSWMMNSA
jgi:PhnB protein